MLKIRLSRTGKKRQPSFRIVVQEHTVAVKGQAIETLGYYRPALKPKEFKVNGERVKYWISVGAQPSDTLASLLKNEGFSGMEAYMAPRNKQRKNKKSGGKEEASPAAPTPAPAAESTPAPAAPAPAAEAKPS